LKILNSEGGALSPPELEGIMKKRYLYARCSIYEVDGDAADGRQIVKTAREYGEWNNDRVYLVEGNKIHLDGFGCPINVIASAQHSPELRDYYKCGK